MMKKYAKDSHTRTNNIWLQVAAGESLWVFLQV